EVHLTLVELLLRIFEFEMEFFLLDAGQLEHGIREDAFADAPQTTGAQLVFHSLVDHEIQHSQIEAQLNTFELEQLFVLADKRVLGLREDRPERRLVERIEMRDYRQTTKQLGDQSKGFEVGCIHILQEVLFGGFLLLFINVEAYGIGIDPAGDDLVHAVKCTAADKEDILGVDLDQLLLGMFPASLWRDKYVRTFQQFEQALLYTFTADVAGNRRVISLSGDLIDLIDVYATPLGGCYVIVTYLQETGQDAL